MSNYDLASIPHVPPGTDSTIETANCERAKLAAKCVGRNPGEYQMREPNRSTDRDLGADISETELAELIEAADASSTAFPDTEGGRLMDSLAIGTGFDIAMVQQGLLPQAANIEIGDFPSESALAASTAIETGPPGETIEPTFNDAYTALAAYQPEIDPLAAHHQHY